MCSSDLTISALPLMIGADLFIFGGGSLLQNSTSDASLLYYLLLIKLSSILCKRRLMLSNGIGPINIRASSNVLPFKRRILKSLLKECIDSFDLISVRDHASREALSSILPSRKIHLCPDPAFTFFNKGFQGSVRDTSKLMPYTVFCPSARGAECDGVSPKRCAKALNHLSRELGAKLIIAVLNEDEDIGFAKGVAKGVVGAQIYIPSSPERFITLLGSAKLVLSQRYHGSLFAASSGAPTLSLSNDPKMISLCRELKLYPPHRAMILRNGDLLLKYAKECISHFQKNQEITLKLVTQSAQKSEHQISQLISHLI